MFEYNGHNISLIEKGLFQASIKGHLVEKKSLVALKRAIDKASAFEEFDALYQRTDYEPYVEARVVGVVRAKGQKSYYNADKWLLEGRVSTKLVIKDTPENRALVNASVAINEEYVAAKRALDEKYGKRHEAARAAIPFMSPE